MSRWDTQDRDVTAQVRNRVEGPPKDRLLECTRVLVRIDYYSTLGELDYSLVAWEHPQARLISNRIWSSYDKAHIGIAPLDIVASIYAAIEQVPDPFP